MKARILPLLPDLEPESESIYTWDIENYRSLTRRERSPKFECGGHPWYVANQSPESAHAKRHSAESVAGGYCSSPSATMSITPPYILSRRMKRRTSRQITGTPVHSSPCACGTRTNLQSTCATVSPCPIQGELWLLLMTLCSCKSQIYCRRKRLGLHPFHRTAKNVCSAVGRHRKSDGRERSCQCDCLHPNLQGSYGRAVA